MSKPLDRVMLLQENLRMSPVDFEILFTDKNDLTPLESIELFLLEQQRLRTEKQNVLRCEYSGRSRQGIRNK